MNNNPIKCPNCSKEITVIDVQCPYCDFYFRDIDVDSIGIPDMNDNVIRSSTNKQLVSAKVKCLSCGHVFTSTWFDGEEYSHRCPECGMDEVITQE